MKRLQVCLIVIILSGVLCCQNLPVFLKADSVQSAKILRFSDDSIFQTFFVQPLSISFAETVIAHDSICEGDTCYPTEIETLRVVLAIGDTARIPHGDDTLIIIGTSENLNNMEIPSIDTNLKSSGDEFSLWNNRMESYCDSLIGKSGQTICEYCGIRQIFEYFYIETTATAILLHKYSSVVYPLEDSCFSHGFSPKFCPEVLTNIEENGVLLRTAPVNTRIPVSGVVENIISENRIGRLFDDHLFDIRYLPESLLIAPDEDTIMIPFAAIDGSWIVRSKWLWDNWAGPNETYSGYVSYWDDAPWGQVDYRDVGPLQLSMSAPAQYIPTYAGDTIGYIDSILAILDNDNLSGDSLYLCYPSGTGCVWGWINIRELFYREFDSTNTSCPIVFSRPVDTLFHGIGDLCDNSHQAFFCQSTESCEESEGMRGTCVNYDRQYFADALHFFGSFDVRTLCEIGLIPYSLEQIQESNPRLIIYTIGTGSIPRMWLNDSLYIIASGTFPAYGNPYNFDYNGHRAVIDSPFIKFDDANHIVLELIAPRPIDLGAQVVLALEFVLPDTVEFLELITRDDIIELNRHILRGTSLADSGNTKDTAVVSDIDTNSAIIVYQRDSTLWKSADYELADSSIIINFSDTLLDDRLWRWWFFTGNE